MLSKWRCFRSFGCRPTTVDSTTKCTRPDTLPRGAHGGNFQKDPILFLQCSSAYHVSSKAHLSPIQRLFLSILSTSLEDWLRCLKPTQKRRLLPHHHHLQVVVRTMQRRLRPLLLLQARGQERDAHLAVKRLATTVAWYVHIDDHTTKRLYLQLSLGLHGVACSQSPPLSLTGWTHRSRVPK